MILTATEKGIVAFSDSGNELYRALPGTSVSFLSVDCDGRLLAIADGNRIMRAASVDSADIEANWTELGSLHDTEANCLAAVSGMLFIGAADARLWAMPCSGGEPERLSSFEEIETRDSWNTPWGGPPDVRSIAVITGGSPAIYADIHVGGIVRSFDMGETWSQAQGSLHRDVHRVSTHPDMPDRVYAATARGCFVSEDTGESWEQFLAPFEPRRYQRCVMPDQEDPNSFLCTVSLGPHPEGETGCEAMIFRTSDRGATWARAHEGLPEHFYQNINTHMLSASVQRPGVFAFHDDQESLYFTHDGARSWKNIATIPHVAAVMVI